MGRRSKKSNDVDTPEKVGNVGVKREPKNETDRSAKKQKLAAAASTNHGMNSMTASIPEKKLPTATSLGENSTSISKKEDDINDHNETGKSGQVHVDEPTRDRTAPGESGKTDDEPHKMSKKRSKKNSKKLSKKKLKKEDDIDNSSDVGKSDPVHVDESTEANQSANKEALKKNGEKLMGCDIVISNDEVGHEGSCNRGKLTIYVKGLDRSRPLEEIRKSLREYFGSCGEITYVLTPVKHGGISKGFAFLGFKDEDALSKALELNNTKLGDFILTVEEGGRRDGSGDGGCFNGDECDDLGGGDDFDSGRRDDIGGGVGALDSSSDFGSGGNSGFGGCPGCDSIFCRGGSFGGSSGNGFNSGNGFRGESAISGGKSGDFGGGSQGCGGGVSHSGGGQGRCGGRSHRGGGRSHRGGGQGRGGGRSHSGGRAQDGGQGHGDGRSHNGGRALNGDQGHGGGRSYSGGRGRGGGKSYGGSRGRY